MTNEQRCDGKGETMPGEARRGQGSVVPPTSNTGAPLQPNTACIDWLEFTIRLETPVDRDYYFRRWSTLLHGAVRLDRGFNGYDVAFSVLGSGTISYSSNKLNMGFHVALPSKALAIFQELEPDVHVYRLLIDARCDNAVFTRIDIAFDTHSLTIEKFIHAIESGELVTMARDVKLLRSMRGEPGATIYIGSPSSDRRVRIYDKAAEQKVDGTWTRIETQYRKKYASQVVGYILQSDVSMESLAASSIDFREVGKSRTNNRERSSWWTELLAAFDNIVFEIKKVKKTAEEIRDWFERSIATTAAFVYAYFGEESLNEILNSGMRKMPPYKVALLYQTLKTQ